MVQFSTAVDTSRTLYTNGEETVFDTKRPVFINGIGQLATQADLLNRLVVIECPVISVSNRISDQEFLSRLSKHGPRALYYLFSVFCRALKKLPEIELESLPRLADFARLGVAVTDVLSEDDPSLFKNVEKEPFMSRYQKQLDEADNLSLEGSPSIDALLEHLETRGGSIESTIGNLFDELRELYGYRKHGWPKTPRGFRNCLDRAMPALRAQGVQVIFQQSRRNGRGITLTTSLFRENSSVGKSSSPPSHNSLQMELERQHRLMREEREQRERYPRLQYYPSEVDFEYLDNFEILACKDDFSTRDHLEEGGDI